MSDQRINFSPAPLPLSTVISQIRNENRGGLDLQPEYQRDFIWNQDFKEKLIYSLVKRYPIGSISVRNLEISNDKNARSEVVDGQQRLTTLYHFITGTPDNSYNGFKIRNDYARKIIKEVINYMGNAQDLKLEKLKSKLEKKGAITLRYDEFPDDIKSDLESYPLSISTISNATTGQITEYFRFLQNQEALRAGEIMKSFPHTFLEKYLDMIEDKPLLLKILNYSDKRLEFDKLFYSIIGLLDEKLPFGSQDKFIKNYVFEKQTDLAPNVHTILEKMINNLNVISKTEKYINDFKPTKRYLKLLLLLTAFSELDWSNTPTYLVNLKFIDNRLAKFSSVSPNALENSFGIHKNLISDYRSFAELCVRTHNYATVTERISKLPNLVENCPFKK